MQPYTGWVIAFIVGLVWEITGLKATKRLLPALGRGWWSHISLSEVVWRILAALTKKSPAAGNAGKVTIVVLCVDLALHFVARTPLLPVLG